MKRFFLGLIALIVVLGIAANIFQVEIGRAVFKTAVERTVSRDTLATLPDGLHVALCGSGSPLPDPGRAGPCTAVIAGKHLFIVDMGSGATRKLAPMGIAAGRAEALFLTHLHSDHIDGLGEFMLQRWVSANHKTPLPVYGPTGVAVVVAGFNAAYAPDASYRVAHHGPDVAPPDGAGGFPNTIAPGTVYEKDGVTITAFAVDHRPVTGAVGYRFDYKGRSVVLSGDTAPSPTVIAAARGADLLIHEALNPEMAGVIGAAMKKAGKDKTAKIMADIPGYHTSPVDAARIADKAGVKALILTHIVPALPFRLLNGYFLDGAHAEYKGPITIGEDGMIFTLPAGSAEIIARLDGVRRMTSPVLYGLIGPLSLSLAGLERLPGAMNGH